MNQEQLNIKQLIPLGDDDIRRLLGPTVKIIEFNLLDDYKNMKELLPKKIDYCIILYGIKAITDGHWVALFKRDNIISFFDSYGLKPEGALKWISKAANESMDQDGNLLINLLNTHKGPIFYNNYSYQNNQNFNIATCGRWSVCFIQYMKMNSKHTLKTFNDFILTLKKKHPGITSDEIVSLLVN